ncbi:hypothetical protein GQ602_007215 [Ophiocordyceps camponoti-floridani]|uniref:Uncharacterized protein n=1 Tax=Ophiocordyceps camponoti-floridani TaxID=2030778 RepID=A0A8H4Q0V1_9HYPO|nr:hypothetical protein GQ602_007215 [Ophiocordyceps camponoti-floridani]
MRASLPCLAIAALAVSVAAHPRPSQRRYSVVPLEPEDDDVTIVQTVVKTEPPVTHVVTTTAVPATVTVTSGTTQTLSLAISSSISNSLIKSGSSFPSSTTTPSPCSTKPSPYQYPEHEAGHFAHLIIPDIAVIVIVAIFLTIILLTDTTIIIVTVRTLAVVRIPNFPSAFIISIILARRSLASDKASVLELNSYRSVTASFASRERQGPDGSRRPRATAADANALQRNQALGHVARQLKAIIRNGNEIGVGECS